MTLGLLPEVFHYLLMSLVSVTAVVSFDVVGATLMISFMIGPATTAYMISKNLKMMLIYSALIGAISSILLLPSQKSFVTIESGLQPEGRHPARGVAASDFRPLCNIPHCCLP